MKKSIILNEMTFFGRILESLISIYGGYYLVQYCSVPIIISVAILNSIVGAFADVKRRQK